jgi:hypothetical protein
MNSANSRNHEPGIAAVRRGLNCNFTGTQVNL